MINSSKIEQSSHNANISKGQDTKVSVQVQYLVAHFPNLLSELLMG